jgi:hypothetical protein
MNFFEFKGILVYLLTAQHWLFRLARTSPMVLPPSL